MGNAIHLKAVGLTVGECGGTRKAARRQRRLTFASAAKVARRVGADRVEFDPRSGRIIVSLAGAGSEESTADAGSNELEDWIAKHASQVKRSK